MKEYIGNEFYFLLPGEVIVTSEPVKISTILGSCVSVCLFDKQKRIAGMNHYMLPLNKTNDIQIYRYGDSSLEDMYIQMIKKGAAHERIAARVYGGSSMFDKKGTNFEIGKLNVEVAIKFLNDYKLEIKSVETGGKKGRKVIFDTSAGMISSTLLK